MSTPNKETPALPKPVMKKMVGWYDPRQLAKTGVEVAVSTIFGRHSDHRLVEALASGDDDDDFYDYTCYYLDDGKEAVEPNRDSPRSEIWIDYVGDTGDGWNSTYAVAYYLAEPGGRSFKYSAREPGKETYKEYEAQTKRGEILILGGDEVYPTASRQEYEERLLAPYATALRESPQDCPHVFALPGNHDWYDSLVSFTRLFTAQRWFGGWRTRQSRSYFALKLPHNWWLLGTDVQLGSDIDKPQMDYFKSLTTEMDAEFKKTGKRARIILCHAEPHWIRAAQYGGDGEDPNYSENNLKALERVLGRSVAVFLAGDLHHYRRHESQEREKSEKWERLEKGETQKITAGGGGAFLHPTHVGLLGKSMNTIVEVGPWDNDKGDRPLRDFKLEGCFPSTKDSRRATWRNLIFPYLKGNESWSFGLVIAALYLLLTLPIVVSIDDLGKDQAFGQITYTLIERLAHSPVSVALILATIVGFWFFTDTHSTRYKVIMGLTHGVTHVLAACAVALLTVFMIATWTIPDKWTFRIPWPGGFQFSFDLRLLLGAVVILLLGFVVGSFIMGLYLLISMNFFGRHGNEAFSSLGIEDWKNFIRLHINENGDLTIYPIGIRRVPRKWKERKDGVKGTGPEQVPDDSNAKDPELIEPPIVMKADPKSDTGVATTSPDRKIESETQSSRPTKS